MKTIKIKQEDYSENQKKEWYVELPNAIIVAVGNGVSGYEDICPLDIEVIGEDWLTEIEGYYTLDRDSVGFRINLDGRTFYLRELINAKVREDDSDYFLIPKNAIIKKWCVDSKYFAKPKKYNFE
jgi:hypothetical protein